jgi:hypothetical protein
MPIKNTKLFIPLGRDVKLLKCNLEFYTELGIEHIYTSVHIRDEWEHGFIENVKDIIKDFPVTITEVYRGNNLALNDRYDSFRKNFCNEKDWVVVADLDEFYEYSMPLAELVRYCETNHYDYITGRFLDRVGPQGDLPEFDENLWDRYPIGLHATRSIAGGCVTKVTLCRSTVDLNGGHHNALSGNGCPEDIASTVVHHFKWDASVIDRLQYMSDMHIENGQPWHKEKDNVLNYLKEHGNRFAIDSPALHVYWPLYRRSRSVAKTGLSSIFEDPFMSYPKMNEQLEFQTLSETEFLVSYDDKLLKINNSGMLLLYLCDGKSNINDIINTIRCENPQEWQTIEHDIQAAMRRLFKAGLLTFHSFS